MAGGGGNQFGADCGHEKPLRVSMQSASCELEASPKAAGISAGGGELRAFEQCAVWPALNGRERSI